MGNNHLSKISSTDPRFLAPKDWAGLVESLPLTRRQMQIVLLILQAKQQKEIGTALSLSRHTAHAYMRQIFRRLNVADRNELVLILFARRAKMRAPVGHRQHGRCQ